MQDSLLLKALRREAVKRTPVWFMRQAGRYLPEYRQLRQQAGSFMALCQTPAYAAEVTIQPLKRFDLDAAIVFSDILTIPDAMGLGLYFNEGEGPRFKHPTQSVDDIHRLRLPHVDSSLSYVMDTISLVKTKIHVPLIGFAGSPWTLACYMIEGGASKQFSIIKKILYQTPELLEYLLDLLTQAVADYLLAQIKAGADVVMLFDTWGGVLEYRAYQQYSLRPMTTIIQRIKQATQTPVIMFTKNGHPWLEQMVASGCDAISIDASISLQEAKSRVGNHVALQGNLDPAYLYAPPTAIRDKVHDILSVYHHSPGHIFNLGHGMLSDTCVDHVSACIAAVHEYSTFYA